MDPIVTLLIGLVLGLAAGLLLARSRRGVDPAVLEAQHQAAMTAARAGLEAELAEERATVRGLREQLASQQEQSRDFGARARCSRR
jgi:sensor domain CHASE-containing protein